MKLLCWIGLHRRITLKDMWEWPSGRREVVTEEYCLRCGKRRAHSVYKEAAP